ncbi:hypothetical protein ABID59_003331 [Bradyrhizobium sp. S3.3.6]|uniref:hypothetical protein n=1 Tax=Bradyrhizobium sp. S3.3.6 TaxID=3156429 RepID=UPI00339709BD
MSNRIWRKLAEPRIWKRLYVERLGEPLLYNIASVFVMAFGSTRQKIEYDCIPRNPYAYCILAAADHAKSYGIKRIAIMEFGVAAGGGLLNMCWIAERVTRETGIEIDVIGFDSGEGMPPPNDYRDHPEKYFTGDFPPIDKGKLIAALPKNARIYYGPIEQTLKQAEAEVTSTVGFIAIDVDYYWSTKQSLDVLAWSPDRYLPSVPMYFDDVYNLDHNDYCGELLAIAEFNKANEFRKIAPMNFLSKWRIFKNAIWHNCVYYAHVFDHKFRSLPYVEAHRTKSAVLTNPYL